MSSLKQQVVSEFEVHDRLVVEPPVVNDVDYRDGLLIIELTSVVNTDWVSLFHKIDPRGSLVDAEPYAWSFSGNKAMVRYAVENQLKMVVDTFKASVDTTNQRYAEIRASEAYAQRKRAIEELQERVRVEERRQRILKELRS